MSLRRTAAGMVAPAMASLAICASAAAQTGHIYWADENDDEIGRVDLDGASNLNEDFIESENATAPTGVAINGTHIYWSHTGSGSGGIGRADITGSNPNPTLITPSSIPGGVGLDANLVYWTHVHMTAGQVGRAQLGGTGVNPTYQATANTTPCGVAANGDRAFWANQDDPGSIGSAHGIDPPDNDYLPDETSDPCGIALAGSFVYWTNRGGTSGTIGRAGLTGVGADESFADTGAGSTPCGVAVAGNHIYWTDPASDTIGRVELDGTTDFDASFVTGASLDDPCGIGVTPTQQATPGTHGFGATTVGGESDLQSFAIANTASSILDVTSATLMGPDAGQFEITGDGCSPASTAPGVNCFVNVAHTPSAEGTHDATLRVVSNASNSPTDIQLTGTGTPPSSEPEPTPDTAPPDTTITEGPSGKTKSKSATFAFSGSDAREVASFECRLDGGSFQSCPSPKAYSGLKKGSHTFEVRAVDAAGNVDPTPASRSWKVKRKKKKK